MKSEKITAEHNFADVMEAAGKFLKATKSDDTRIVAGMVVILANRCDQLERQVEKLNLSARKTAAAESASVKKSVATKKK
jgi:hypothetical protein